MENLLEIEELNKRFGGLEAVSDFSLRLKRGELKGLIGPNGAGKTTIFNLVTGFHRSDRGRIIFQGRDITNDTPDRRVNLGIGRTFQKIRMEKYVKVIDEVKTAFFRHMKSNIVEILLQTKSYRIEEERIEEEALEILEFLGIGHLAQQFGEDLPFGLQRKVSVARALALNPRLLMLDEPTSGLSPGETKEMVDLISKMKKRYDLTILLIEHDMTVIMSICQDIVAINEGRIIGTGTPQEIQSNERVIEAYLGGVS